MVMLAKLAINLSQMTGRPERMQRLSWNILQKDEVSLFAVIKLKLPARMSAMS